MADHGVQRPYDPFRRLGSKVEAIKVHHFVPGSHEIKHECVLCVVASVDFGDGAKLGVGTEDEVDGGGRPYHFAGAVLSFEEVVAAGGFLQP